MADMKVDELGVSVARDPSLMTGSVPTKEWQEVPAEFKPGNFCYPAKASMVEYHSKALPGLFGEPREWDIQSDDWTSLDPLKSLWTVVFDAVPVLISVISSSVLVIQRICRFYGLNFLGLFIVMTLLRQAKSLVDLPVPGK